MTLVAVWLHDFDAPTTTPRVHAIADTRISGSPGNVLTDHGPKILPLPIICRTAGRSGFIDLETFKGQFGFAFAGATLPALSTHALASTLFSNLAHHAEAPKEPSLFNVAYAVANVASHYMKEVGQISERGALFKAVVFGFCPVELKYAAFEIRPKIEADGLKIELNAVVLDHSTVVVIGSDEAALRASIEEMRNEPDLHPINYCEAPMRALRKYIQQNPESGVGGSIQQAWYYPYTLELVATMQPIVPIPPSPRNAGLFVLGFDIFDMQMIGHHQVILKGR